MERSEQLRVVEALILGSPEPLSPARVAQITPESTPALVKELVAELNEAYEKESRAFEIWEVAGGYQIRTRAEFSGYLQQLQKERPLRLSRAALETLAIVAYKQPATRADIENVRGVDVGATLRSLLERSLVKIDGHKEVPGRPMLYGTTRRFLEVFGLESLKDLPALRELEDLAREQGLRDADSEEGEPGEEGDPDLEAGETVDASAEIGDEPGELGDEPAEGAETSLEPDPLVLEDDSAELDAIDASLDVEVQSIDPSQLTAEPESEAEESDAPQDGAPEAGDATLAAAGDESISEEEQGADDAVRL